MHKRMLNLSLPKGQSAFVIDLLQQDVHDELLKAPHHLREMLAAIPKDQLVIIDELQKILALLDESKT